MVRSIVMQVSVVLALTLALNISASAGFLQIETVTNTADSGAGSLRAAILNANSQPSTPTEIRFNIPGDGPFIIRPLTSLPSIVATVNLLGDSQPGTTTLPLIVLDGYLTGGFPVGLEVKSDNSLIRGMAIGNFSFIGLAISNSTSVTVKGCHIGTTFNGTGATPNGVGVLILDSADCQIGGSVAGERNLISGNDTIGVFVTGNLSNDNVIQGNLIGTSLSGIAPLPNDEWGIMCAVDTDNTLIGGPQPGDGNVISANGLPENGPLVGGIHLEGRFHTVQGNLIGLGSDGTTPLGNSANGIRVEYALQCHIGGQTSLERNVISNTRVGTLGNDEVGINVGASASQTRIQGNFIGTDVTGTEGHPNTSGIRVINATLTVIGGAGVGEGNLISANSTSGLYVAGDVNGTVVQGNLLGTDVTGLRALGNDSGMQLINIGGEVMIGGIDNAGNVISGNRKMGVALGASTFPSQRLILGNLIGVGADGVTPLGNGTNGIEMVDDSGAAEIGSLSAGNIIAHNREAGIRMKYLGIYTIRGNQIFSNADMGLDWRDEGVTLNEDESDYVTNFPVITGAVFTEAGLGISGSITTFPNSDITLDFYLSPTCDASGYGEGWEHLASLSLLTGASGTASFNEVLFIDLETEGRYVTATTTSSSGNTSEFSRCVRVAGRGPSAQEIVDFLLDLIPDPGDLNLNSDGVVNSADVVTSLNTPPG